MTVMYHNIFDDGIIILRIDVNLIRVSSNNFFLLTFKYHLKYITKISFFKQMYGTKKQRKYNSENKLEVTLYKFTSSIIFKWSYDK